MPPDVDVFLARARDAYGPDSGAKARVRAAVIAATSASTAAIATKAAAAKLSGSKLSGTLVSLFVGGAVSSALLVGALANSGSSQVSSPRQGVLNHAALVAAEEHPRLMLSAPTLSIDVPSAEPVPTPDVHRGELASAPSPEPKTRDLAEELKLIRRAAQALREGQSAEARRALGEHRRRFPQGKLSVERWGLEVLTQCSAGTTPSAREAAERFLESAPSSPLAGHVREDCLK